MNPALGAVMSIRIRSFALLGVLALATGCAGFTSQYEVDKLRKAELHGSPFAQRLAREYRDFAGFEQDVMRDYDSAQYFAQKGLQAAAGTEVPPEDPVTWDIDKQHLGELSTARQRLTELLDRSPAKAKVPDDSAVAQTRYDCWVEQQSEGWQMDHIAACRTEFERAMGVIQDALAPKIVAAPPPAPSQEPPVRVVKVRSYFVFFDWNSAEMTETAMKVIESVADDARRNQAGQVAVIGHTDSSGSADYNLKLSQTRATNVGRALVGQGIPARMISLDARGEQNPLVTTGDNVREPSNRRAEIQVE